MNDNNDALGLKQRQLRLLEEALERKREEAEAARRRRARDIAFWGCSLLAAFGIVAGNYALAKYTGRLPSAREQARAQSDADDPTDYADYHAAISTSLKYTENQK